MPLYEYQCGRCGRFEVIRKFSDEPLTTCPTCGEDIHKLLSAPAIQFKGTGWYVTDYARKSSSESKAADGGTTSKDSSAKESSSKDSSSKDSSSKDTGTSTTATSKDGAATSSSPAK